MYIFSNNISDVERFKVSIIEADTKIIVHPLNALKECCNIVVCGNDTDVIGM